MPGMSTAVPAPVGEEEEEEEGKPAAPAVAKLPGEGADPVLCRPDDAFDDDWNGDGLHATRSHPFIATRANTRVVI